MLLMLLWFYVQIMWSFAILCERKRKFSDEFYHRCCALVAYSQHWNQPEPIVVFLLFLLMLSSFVQNISFLFCYLLRLGGIRAIFLAMLLLYCDSCLMHLIIPIRSQVKRSWFTASGNWVIRKTPIHMECVFVIIVVYGFAQYHKQIRSHINEVHAELWSRPIEWPHTDCDYSYASVSWISRTSKSNNIFKFKISAGIVRMDGSNTLFVYMIRGEFTTA